MKTALFGLNLTIISKTFNDTDNCIYVVIKIRICLHVFIKINIRKTGDLIAIKKRIFDQKVDE